NPIVPLDQAVTMVNFDMVGRLRDGKLIVYGVETADEMRAIVDGANTTGALSIRAVGDGYGPSDHSSFYGKGIPVLHLFTDLHDDYHRATDDADKVSAEGIARIVGYAERVIRDIASRPGRLTPRQAAAPAPRAAGSGSGVYLGSIPDMGSDVKGMQLTGVRAGSPADDAGIRAGDVIVRFGGREVTDIYTYTDAMNAFKPGDVVEVELLREGQRVVAQVTLGRRP
ncbi:MAG: M28 family peptidase, partial [Gemmatimonadaceae bacterium]|nr:M28 family peptidase [Gemmatimonadaceae bacterium]